MRFIAGTLTQDVRRSGKRKDWKSSRRGCAMENPRKRSASALNSKQNIQLNPELGSEKLIVLNFSIMPVLGWGNPISSFLIF